MADEHAPHVHVTSIGVYLAVFGALAVGTMLTWYASTVDLGWANTPIALIIATIKAVLVILFFMHVIHSSRLTWVVVTGGAGFIGSNFIRYIFKKYSDARIVNLDKLTYAGIRENLAEFEGSENYRFLHGDIAKPEDVAEAYRGVDGSGVDVVVNFAAETHVDRSLMEAGSFIQTDVHGVLVLLEEARKHAPNLKRFVQISTDEVYGSIAEGSFRETDSLNPRNPYSASKAGGDRMAYAYAQTYELPVIVTRASNNFGAFQYPEKLIPLFVTNAIDDKPLPLYGDGKNVRDWLFVDDHCAAVDFLIERGTNSETYNIGGGNEKENREITAKILELLKKPDSLIKQV